MTNQRIAPYIMCSIFTALTAVGAFIRIPIPIIPFTLQFFFTTLAGLLLGAKYGGLSVLTYVLLGLVGLPIFTAGGGIGYVFQPTFGYLVGFVVAAYVTGAIANAGRKPSYKRLLVASYVGLVIVYSFGLAYCYLIKNFYLGSGIGLWPLFLHGFLLVVPSDVVLCAVAAIVAKRLAPVLRRVQEQGGVA